MTDQIRRALACVAAFIAIGIASHADAQSPLRWHGDLKQGAESARSSGKPLFVVFRCVR